jgi:hypothetical protein
MSFAISFVWATSTSITFAWSNLTQPLNDLYMFLNDDALEYSVGINQPASGRYTAFGLTPSTTYTNCNFFDPEHGYTNLISASTTSALPVYLPYRFRYQGQYNGQLHIPDIPFFDTTNSRNLMVAVEYLHLITDASNPHTFTISSLSLSTQYYYNTSNIQTDGIIFTSPPTGTIDSNTYVIYHNTNITSSTISNPIPNLMNYSDGNISILIETDTGGEVSASFFEIVLLFYRYSGNDGF